MFIDVKAPRASGSSCDNKYYSNIYRVLTVSEHLDLEKVVCEQGRKANLKGRALRNADARASRGERTLKRKTLRHVYEARTRSGQTAVGIATEGNNKKI